jgi:signal transduction histidine kinase
VDLVPLVHDVVETLTALGDTDRVRVRIEAPPTAQVWADAGALRQVLINLLDNAVKYGPAEQTVSITIQQHASEVRVLVDDQGPGVAPSDRARIWRAFERAHASRPDGGSGLGLSVVRQVVAAHGGRVAVGDAPGGGARFSVTLPAHAPAMP